MSVCDDDDEQDIYRGDPPLQEPLADPAQSISSLSSESSSSSSSFSPRGRFGTIAAKLEHAITRWSRNVRGNSSTSSSSSSSSSSSCSSVVTLTKSQIARRHRKRNRSISSLRTFQSEREIVSRITRMKALEKSREIPREFALYLPLSLRPAAHQLPGSLIGTDMNTKKEMGNHHILWTTSLPLVLAQLDIASRKSGKHRRLRHHQNETLTEQTTSVAASRTLTQTFFGIPSPSTSQVRFSSPGSAPKAKKGKQREAQVVNEKLIPISIQEDPPLRPAAWFLDVANPTWADLRAIGKLLHIHPLTLEDILQQDPREKLELFSKLGYYFISFRAIESPATKEKIQREAKLEDPFGPSKSILDDDGPIGAANVYLAVFKDGLCCFHFTDISEHTDRVRNRMVLLEKVVNMTSDWIAHGILDSIVDSFFPFLEEIEKEVMAIDLIVYNHNTEFNSSDAVPSVDLVKLPQTDLIPPTKVEESPISEKYPLPHLVSLPLTIRLLLRRAQRHVANIWKQYWKKPNISPGATQLTLRRMVRARKLVTGLGRLLGTKSDVVTQIRKRLMRSAQGEHTSEALEVAIYLGDVQDHILTLQNALAHYERMLSQSHPIYLAQLRSMFEKTKCRTDMNLLYLTIISIAGLCLQPLIGLFSLNVTVPTNPHQPGGSHVIFGVLLIIVAVIIAAFLCIVRYWWETSKRQRRRRAPL